MNNSRTHGHQQNAHQHNHPSTTQPPQTTVIVTNPVHANHPNGFFATHHHVHHPYQHPQQHQHHHHQHQHHDSHTHTHYNP
ncbi:hypothetical protein OQJ26_02725 [Legionella sp. PATHC038]|uniref:hypothetical protein n=1 Tax=Legionella sheltonii TaxID=2992041 RepID=UPI0022448709|nr:hypothetical protein [Legionella sp. PATHC038]MCW8397700.1 hypothetical protein [Legionella sp. PATHC038]